MNRFASFLDLIAPRVILVVGLVGFVLLTTGCAMEYVPLMGSSTDELHPSVRSFFDEFEQVYALESRFELKRLIADRFGGHLWGEDRILDRMDEVFNQYSNVELQTRDITLEEKDFWVASFYWTLTWQCETINPEQGCPDVDNDGSPDRIRRAGQSTFNLIRSGGRWEIKFAEGDLLLGAFEPGYRLD